MGIFDFLFKKKDTDNTDKSSNPEEIPDLPRNLFVDDSDPNYNTSSPSLEFGTKLPIDIIYGFLKEDYESKAYNDALVNPDKSYKEKNLTIIKSNLEIKFKQVLLKYEDMIREIEFHIKSRTEAGLTDLVELLKSRKETYIKHVEELNHMKNDLEQGELYMTGLFQSYEVGFTKGLASLSIHNLKIDNNSL